MTEERTTLLRERMIEGMRIRGLGEKAQKAHIRGVKEFARFLKRSADTATLDDLRAYQLYMTNARVTALRFFLDTTCQERPLGRALTRCVAARAASGRG